MQLRKRCVCVYMRACVRACVVYWVGGYRCVLVSLCWVSLCHCKFICAYIRTYIGMLVWVYTVQYTYVRMCFMCATAEGIRVRTCTCVEYALHVCCI